MESVDRDWLVRQHAFRFLEVLSLKYGDALPWEALRDGVETGSESPGSGHAGSGSRPPDPLT